MQSAVSQSLFSYWNALRKNRPAPKRFEIEPSRIANNLPDTFILERLDHTNIRFRLAGTRITDALGMELRGRNLFDLFSAGDAKTLEAQMELITTHCAVGLFRMSAVNADGISVTFEILILPLTHIRDSVERYVGCIVPIDKPDWLGRVPLTNYTLVEHSIIWPDGRSPDADDFAGHQIPLLLTRRDARIVKSARRQFRVYDGGLTRPTEER
jgi:hypothetical protein